MRTSGLFAEIFIVKINCWRVLVHFGNIKMAHPNVLINESALSSFRVNTPFGLRNWLKLRGSSRLFPIPDKLFMRNFARDLFICQNLYIFAPALGEL